MGFKSVAIDCRQYELLARLTDATNGRELKTAEGFTVKVSLRDVVGFSITKLAHEYKVK